MDSVSDLSNKTRELEWLFDNPNTVLVSGACGISPRGRHQNKSAVRIDRSSIGHELTPSPIGMDVQHGDLRRWPFGCKSSCLVCAGFRCMKGREQALGAWPNHAQRPVQATPAT